MYNTNIKTKSITLYDLYTSTVIRTFISTESLCAYLASKTRNYCGIFNLWEKISIFPNKGHWEEFFLRDVNYSWTDTYGTGDCYSGRNYSVRRYVYYDENRHIIDIRDLYDDVKRKFYEPLKKIELTDDYEYGDALIRGHRKYCCKKVYRYRVDPVPGVSKGCYRGYYRKVKTHKEKVLNNIPEYKEFVRPSRRNLPDSWSDFPRSNDFNWKSQSKKRKQWM